ncbi:MAG: hypothetical protein AB7O59_22325 [Pirellulales bacterium]
MMREFWNHLTAVWGTPAEDATPCTTQANSYREVVSLQAVFVTLTVALLAYVQSAPTFQFRVDAMFALLAAVPIIGLYQIVRGRIRTEQGDVYVCTQPIRAYAKQSLILDLSIVVAVSLLYWQRQLPGQ